MSCENCMIYRPDLLLKKIKEFICLECGEVYVLSGCGSGQYWESKKEQEDERNKGESI